MKKILLTKGKRANGPFSAEAEAELQYVFPEISVDMIRQKPEIQDDGTWICSCGRRCGKEQCTVCKMTKTDAIEKLSEEYLLNHRRERNDQKKETRQQMVQSLTEIKTKNLKVRWKKPDKMKAAIGVVAAIIVVMLTGIYNIRFNHGLRAMYFMYQAEYATVYEEQVNAYSRAISEKPTSEAYEKLLALKLEHHEYGTDTLISRCQSLYPENEKIQKMIEENKPQKPVSSLESGNYDEWKTLELSSQNQGERVYYKINDGDYTEIDEEEFTIPFNENGEYRIMAYTENWCGLTSDEAEWDITIQTVKPTEITADVASGDYEKNVQVTLSQEENFKIYYTLDGSDPTDQSLVYQEPISCTRGITEIKAICYSDKDVASDIFSTRIGVRYPVHDTRHQSESSCQYDYLATTSGLLQYRFDGTYEESISNKNCNAVAYYQGKIYYSDVDGIWAYDEHSGTQENISKEQTSQLVVAQNKIWYSKEGQVWSMNLDTTEPESWGTGSTIQAYDDVVYYSTYSELVEVRDGERSESGYESGDFVFYQDKIYVADGRIRSYLNGNYTVLVDSVYNRNQIQPNAYKWSNGRQSVYSVDYYNIAEGGGQLYVGKKTYSSSQEISWLTNELMSDITSTTNWVTQLYNAETNTLTSCQEPYVRVVGDGYYSSAMENPAPSGWNKVIMKK